MCSGLDFDSGFIHPWTLAVLFRVPLHSLMPIPQQGQITPFNIKGVQYKAIKTLLPDSLSRGNYQEKYSCFKKKNKQLQNGSFCLFFFYQPRDESSINICHVSSCNPSFLFPPKLLQFRVTLIFKVDKNHKTLPVVGRIREYIMLFSRWDLNKQ